MKIQSANFYEAFFHFHMFRETGSVYYNFISLCLRDIKNIYSIQVRIQFYTFDISIK